MHITERIRNWDWDHSKFWDRINCLKEPFRPDLTPCWMWMGAKTNLGYGFISIHGVMYSTHKLSYELHYGLIPDGVNICHRCDQPPCCNPEHLEAGSQRHNMRGCASRGRISIAKLDPELIVKLREQTESLRLPNGKLPAGVITDLAKILGVSRTNISQALSGKAYRYLV